MTKNLKQRLRDAIQADQTFLCERSRLEETFGHDAHYLEEILCITKSDLIRLERLGLAVKCRYQTQNTNLKKRFADTTGPHRVRWVIFKDVEAVLGSGQE